uniref:Uncharacterized protein n=1 Tax=Octopus bimaculoides TaxID=37653 RepID=A0A0L8HCU2_OCTBM
MHSSSYLILQMHFRLNAFKGNICNFSYKKRRVSPGAQCRIDFIMTDILSLNIYIHA